MLKEIFLVIINQRFYILWFQFFCGSFHTLYLDVSPLFTGTCPFIFKIIYMYSKVLRQPPFYFHLTDNPHIANFICLFVCLEVVPFLLSPLFQIFHKRMPPEAIDLASRLLQYSPSLRCTAVCFIILFFSYGLEQLLRDSFLDQ